MAGRRGKNSTTNPQNTNEVPKEDTVSTAAPEAPASTNETPAEAKPAEAEVDLTAFNAAVEAAVTDTEARDAATGELAESLIEPVNAEYRKLDGAKAKNKAKQELGRLMKETMNKLDMPLARSYMILSEKLTAAGGGTKSERTPADPTEAFVQRIVGLELANRLAKAHVPEGVAENWSEKANELFAASQAKADELFAWLNADEDGRGDEPEVSPVVRSAVKLAQGKAAKVGGSVRTGGGSGDGVRRDIAKHIISAFADKESGTFLTIAEIKNHTSEEYGENSPSAGAISARLFPSSGKESTVEGVKPDTQDGKKGAVKL